MLGCYLPILVWSFDINVLLYMYLENFEVFSTCLRIWLEAEIIGE